MPVIDLSHPIDNQTPLYPGTPPNQIKTIATFATDGFRESQWLLSAHTATHIDTPSHILEHGFTLDAYEPGQFIGKGKVIPFNEEQLKRFIGSENADSTDFLLLHSGWDERWGNDDYFNNYPLLPENLAGQIAKLDLKGIGIDAPSFDAPDSANLPIHRLILGEGLILIENLHNLRAILNQSFTFIALPLRISAGEASPVRAVALMEE